MKILLLILLLSTTSFGLSKKDRLSTTEFNQWLFEQNKLVETPIENICHQTCSNQYFRCTIKLRATLLGTRKHRQFESKNQQTCIPLYDKCLVECADGVRSFIEQSGQDLDNTPPENQDNSTTPPDSDASDDETNNPGDPNQPPVL